MHTELDRRTSGAQAPDCVDRLRRLPDEMPPPYNWQEFQRRSQQHSLGLPVRLTRLDWRHAAVAAVVVLVIGSVALWVRVGTVSPSAAGRSDPAERSRAIENWLSSLPPEPTVVRVGTRAAAVGLEDQIAQVDELLTSARLDGARPDRLAVLQLERVRLVGSLAQVRYAEVAAAE
jgi:hypothetical protein